MTKAARTVKSFFRELYSITHHWQMQQQLTNKCKKALVVISKKSRKSNKKKKKKEKELYTVCPNERNVSF